MSGDDAHHEHRNLDFFHDPGFEYPSRLMLFSSLHGHGCGFYRVWSLAIQLIIWVLGKN